MKEESSQSMGSSSLYKLVALYMLEKAGGELDLRYISSFLLENTNADFGTLVATYDELVESGFALRKEWGKRTLLVLTDQGKETLDFFSDALWEDLKNEIRRYLKKVGREIVNEQSVRGEYYHTHFEDYMVRLSIQEKERGFSDKTHTLLLLEISVPTKEAAQKVVSGWKEKSAPVYQYLLETLLK